MKIKNLLKGIIVILIGGLLGYFILDFNKVPNIIIFLMCCTFLGYTFEKI